jgi:hypothetical protein
MAGVLNFQQYVGGPDSVQVEQIFPSNQRTLLYNFGQDITGWTFSTDYQTIVVDSVKFSRSTGQPNFSESTVIGFFPKVEIEEPFAPEVINALEGTVKIHFPAGMYSGAIYPDARKNVPVTVFAVTWTDNSTPPQVNTHRWALVQCWEPDVAPGDPTLEDDYSEIVLGA